ncbi:hypothetical protein U0E23_26895 [Burkholderia stagnalis]|uniref:hypothetical protein n=1 Tax=Burkholderia stagnalis TaxID=1503054 RepID=UPI000753B565|nr:hypothetical protein [Burkholderia stagnalis]KWI32007.1 hypothetical protein WT71_10735 [Burkholderia stagnalis]KWI72804.1 hypothetical protein WT73_11225 [Burkholderia stagnalis]MDY7806074.1 hypothetical protein [Burkholderia stagnalis]
MDQLFLKMPHLHRTLDRPHADLIATAQAIATAHGLNPCGPVGWDNGLRDAARVSLHAYRPRHERGNRYAVIRFFDGRYASVECVTPEQAAQALSASTRAEFEGIVSHRAAHLAGDSGAADSDDGDASHAVFLSADVDAQSSSRDGGQRAGAVQLPLF